LWDRWTDVTDIMRICLDWNPYREAGNWPDADMLPLGKISIRSEATYLSNQVERYTRLTPDEQYSMMTFWTMFRSPLMFGGNLPDNDQISNDLITNQEVLDILKNSTDNKQVYSSGNKKIWTATDTSTGDIYLAVFNLNSSQKSFDVIFSDIGLDSTYLIRDLWAKKDIGTFTDIYPVIVKGHGTLLFKLTKQNQTSITATGLINLRVYPNPTEKDVTISFENSVSGAVCISVFTLLGVSVYNKVFDDSATNFNQDIYLGNLNQGQYILKVESKGNTIVSKLLIE
jgi:hypothetical protein